MIQTKNACIEMLWPGRGRITFCGGIGPKEFSSRLLARRIVENAAISSIISFDEWNQLIEEIYRLDLPEQPPIEDVFRGGRLIECTVSHDNWMYEASFFFSYN